MLAIEKVDHIGIRISSKEQSVAFYELLGFKTLTDTGFDQGHPLIMEHPSGVVLNLLGPSNASAGGNILMDTDDKHPGITHVSYKVASIDETKTFLATKGIELTGEFSFKGMQAVFIRDPDRNVIELDAYAGTDPSMRQVSDNDAIGGYASHPD